MFSLHAKARQGRVRKAGTVRELLHTTDVTHGLLPFPQGWGWDLYLILLIWKDQESEVVRIETFGWLCLISNSIVVDYRLKTLFT